MKFSFLSLTFLLVVTTLAAQSTKRVQIGHVYEHNSKKRPLGFVAIIFADALPETSDNNGQFRLAFTGKKPGDPIFYQRIEKEGYELVNGKDLRTLRMGTSDSLGKDLILAKLGVVDAAKKTYYGISDQALYNAFKKEEDRLKKQRDAASLSIAEYARQIEDLTAWYNNEQKQLEELADLFARINTDEMSSKYREAFDLFTMGNIDAALQVLEKANPLASMEQHLNDKKDIERRQKELQLQKEQNEKGIKEDLALVQLLGPLYVLTFQMKKAEELYDEVWRIDSTDLQILTLVADFYRKNHSYDQALRLLPQIINHPQSEEWEQANALSHIGEMNLAKGFIDAALNAHLDCYHRYVEMSAKNPGVPFYKHSLAVSAEKLGSVYAKLGRTEKALAHYEEYTKLALELDKTTPQNPEIIYELALSYEKMGTIQTQLGQFQSALEHYIKYVKLSEELYEGNKEVQKFEKGLATSYLKLGEAYTSLDNAGDAAKALWFFQKANQVLQNLYNNYPEGIEFKNALAVSYLKLGETHLAQDNFLEALPLFTKFNQLAKELSAFFPQNVGFKNLLLISWEKLAIAYLKLGEANAALNKDQEAITLFQQCYLLARELHKDNPSTLIFKHILANSCEKLGSAYKNLGYPDKALPFFAEGAKWSKELYTADPHNEDYTYGLAVAYFKLGVAYLTSDKKTAESYLLQCQALLQQFPNSPRFQESLVKVQGLLENIRK